MKYKMVCIDMDGTLLNRRKRISKVNKKIIKEAHDRGVEIVVTTGRLYNNAAYFSRILGVNSPVIAANGAIVIDQKTNEVIYEQEIPTDTCIKVLEILQKNKIHFHFNTTSTIYCNSFLSKLATKMYMSKHINLGNIGISYKVVRKGIDWINTFKAEEGKIAKCIAVSPCKEKVMLVRKELETLGLVKTFASGSHSIEINFNKVSKANAIKALLDKYGIDKSELMCIGDNENDISMIEFSGLGVAMGNAIDSLKKVADYITDTNNNDGVAKAIQKFILD